MPSPYLKYLGLIDSGIGGLTFLSPLMRYQQEKRLNLFYCCDTIHVPWGEKSQEFMLQQIRQMTTSLLGRGKIDAIFLARNTATAETIDHLRKEFPTPFIGIEPYLNYVSHAQEINSQKIALILTRASFQSQRFQDLRKKIQQSSLIDIYPLPKLAMILEQLKTTPLMALIPAINEELAPLKGKNYTHLIPGCTHYPLIAKHIEQELSLEIVDPAPRILKRIMEVLNLPELKYRHTTLTGSFDWSEDAGANWMKKSLKDFPFLLNL